MKDPIECTECGYVFDWDEESSCPACGTLATFWGDDDTAVDPSECEHEWDDDFCVVCGQVGRPMWDEDIW